MKKIILTILTLIFLVSINNTFAAAPVSGDPNGAPVTGNPTPPRTTTPSQPAQKLQNPLKVNSIEAVILLAVDIAIYIGTAFAILAIIFVGFKFVMAQGNADKITEAKSWFFYIIIGLAILISSKVIVVIVENTLIKSGVVKEGVFR